MDYSQLSEADSGVALCRICLSHFGVSQASVATFELLDGVLWGYFVQVGRETGEHLIT